MRYLIIDNEKIYHANSNIVAFITGALLQLGVDNDKELKRLGDICENVYLKASFTDLGRIVDYVYEQRDKIEEMDTREILDEITGGQW
jgi:hypothetical protein